MERTCDMVVATYAYTKLISGRDWQSPGDPNAHMHSGTGARFGSIGARLLRAQDSLQPD